MQSTSSHTRSVESVVHQATVEIDGERTSIDALHVGLSVSPADHVAVALTLAELHARWGKSARARFIMMAQIITDAESKCAQRPGAMSVSTD